MKLLVGYARVDITPTEPMPLAGYGNHFSRISQNILDPLYSTCMAFTGENGETVLLFHNDLITSPEEFSIPVRKAISESTGVPFSHILICATHNHSSPYLNDLTCAPIARFHQFAKERLVECAKQALADRKEATLETAKNNTVGLNHVRHYVLADGSFRGDNFGDLNKSPMVGHTTLSDPEMRIVKFKRAGEKDILLVNWQAHPHRTSGGRKYDISSDVVGAMRQALEDQLSCRFIYFSGASGNLNTSSRIKEENPVSTYIEHGQALAKCAMEAVFHPVKTGPVKLVERIINEPVCRPTGERVADAQKVREFFLENGPGIESIKVAEAYGFNSPYAAGALIGHHTMKADAIPMPLYVFSIGDVAFVTAPYEMFDTNGKYIRDNSPFDTTIISTCANDQNGYIPSAYGYIHGCYEADTTFFAPGTGEKYANIYVEMLKSL